MLRATEFELCSYHFHNIFIKFGKFELLHSYKLDPYKMKSVYLFLLKTLDFRAYTSNLIAVLCRSSHRRCSLRKGVLRNFSKFTAKHLCQSLFFNKVAGLRPFLQNTSGRLLLTMSDFHSSTISV